MSSNEQPGGGSKRGVDNRDYLAVATPYLEKASTDLAFFSITTIIEAESLQKLVCEANEELEASKLRANTR